MDLVSNKLMLPLENILIKELNDMLDNELEECKIISNEILQNARTEGEDFADDFNEDKVV